MTVYLRGASVWTYSWIQFQDDLDRVTLCLRGTTLAVSKEGTSVIEKLLFTDFGLITGGALFHSSIAIQGNVRGYHQCHVSSVREKEGFPLQLLQHWDFFSSYSKSKLKKTLWQWSWEDGGRRRVRHSGDPCRPFLAISVSSIIVMSGLVTSIRWQCISCMYSQVIHVWPSGP